MSTLFVSDLHLEAERPDIGNQFIEFLKNEAMEADELYILGDLFEAWVGDDDPNTHYAKIKMAIRKVVDKGVPVYFMHGNRDFMIGRRFANETGVEILNDPYPVDMYGQKALLSHGDALCTDDQQYQRVRVMTRNPDWQASILAKPLKERLRIAEEARRQSLERTLNMSMDIMDVNQDEVRRVIIEHGVDVLLHGHTHRPGVHNIDLGNRKAQRIVLGDWYRQGSVVRWDLRGPKLREMPRP
ncbi:MAG: UDP-2,3-diacylglucosamine diphosphatase [Gammaproteobacteria bacterium]|nr:UDP-2,3-diacylglucosamine diphosphatase [Gammaproteobacteria bacterium]MDH5304569.1 UDP-2,3-diacylglucosamine diphosphatase [Gammaproteobacteria bacterium]MDH5322575.1 UDP-2,3-diacylglucosamine diphosphatase [Gammaproteobacteria bacterium]